MVKTPPNEVFTENLLVLMLDNFGHRTSFHVVEENPNSAFKVINFFGANELLTIQDFYKATLIDDILSLLVVSRLSILQRE